MEVDNLRIRVLNGVYPPSEDTYLLTDNLPRISSGLALDMGSGTGIIALKLARGADRVIAVDINLKAAINTLLNAKLNELSSKVDVICANLFYPFRRGLKFDLITFNPPYLPVNDGNGALERSWSGGRGGIEVIKGFLYMLPTFLKEDGKVLMVISSLTDLGSLKRIASRKGVSIKMVKRVWVGLFEELYLLELKLSSTKSLN
ncbi:MAG: protoporphyrinogen oxidase [Thermofilum sp. ex4484_15]|nr:MAG: protoporphyrinogen oxidase [Thermofilum sp. ex4484_15]